MTSSVPGLVPSIASSPGGGLDHPDFPCDSQDFDLNLWNTISWIKMQASIFSGDWIV